MPQPNNAPIVVTAQTSGFDDAMRDISRSAEQFGHVFAATMRGAVLSGRDLDDTLRAIGLRLADLALGKALSPIENAISDLFSGAFPDTASGGKAGGPATPAANVTVNVTTADAPSFAKSQAQIAATLARAVGRGQRLL